MTDSFAASAIVEGGRSPGAADANPGTNARAVMGHESAELIAHARQLDARLRTISHADRQLTRRAAGHVSQLARRLSGLLARSSTPLPIVPGANSQRAAQYVLHAQECPEGVRMLTIALNGVLRTGASDAAGRVIIWTEYNPMEQAGGWPLEVVLAHLGSVLRTVEGKINELDTRMKKRTVALTGLMLATVQPTPPREPARFAPAPPDQARGIGAAAVPALADALPPPADALPTLADALPESRIEGEATATAPDAAPPAPPTTKDDAAARHRRKMLERIQ